MNSTYLRLVLLAGVTSLSSMADGQEGLEPYTPTREEWVVVLFNSSYQIDKMATHGFQIKYACPPGSGTLVIHVSHRADADKEAVKESVDLARKMVAAYAKSKGWEGWLKTTERFVTVPGASTTASADPPPFGRDELRSTLKEVLQEVLKDVNSPQGK